MFREGRWRYCIDGKDRIPILLGLRTELGPKVVVASESPKEPAVITYELILTKRKKIVQYKYMFASERRFLNGNT